ncbi:hypothetical protein P6F26_04770 [Roseibacterium sp. SDUM158017]|uniref:hypothetical protein n=1 Tax=Roseicyclus salinarum TaxID=3036773 RepID=UPI002414FC76|nr:hypothetical protein [Roseibacterium sp. SDUM158017]MDG4647745.1 hypothetical protein [Roseibacterium sp. SDUM158017]
MLVVAPDTIANAGVLETRSLPKKFLGRVQLVPRGAGIGLWARFVVEMQFVRYMAALIPFMIIPFMSYDLALPVTQAPLAMLVVIAVIELKVLRLSKAGRERLVSEDEAARRVDAFAFRARGALRRIAARREMSEGEITLVLEQSELARVAPLTLVSVQSATPEPHVLDLDAAERAILHETLFDDELTERMLHAANLRDDTAIREVRIESRSVSAHSRLAAWLERQDERQADAEAAGA